VATLSFLASGWIVSLGGLNGYKALSYNNLSTSFSLGGLGNHKILTFFSYKLFMFLFLTILLYFSLFQALSLSQNVFDFAQLYLLTWMSLNNVWMII